MICLVVMSQAMTANAEKESYETLDDGKKRLGRQGGCMEVYFKLNWAEGVPARLEDRAGGPQHLWPDHRAKRSMRSAPASMQLPSLHPDVVWPSAACTRRGLPNGGWR